MPSLMEIFLILNCFRMKFDVNKIPDSVFREERMSRYPYRKEDFQAEKLIFTYSISELFNTSDNEYIEKD